jgi:plasmid stabilization system protein ParE
MTTVRTTGRADREVARIDTWWRENRTAAPDLFLDELVETTRRLARTPHIGAAYRQHGAPELRRVLMQATRFHVYYHYNAARGEVVVVSVWSALRGRGPRVQVK